MAKRRVDEDKMEKVNGGGSPFFDQRSEIIKQNVNAMGQLNDALTEQIEEAPAIRDNIVNDVIFQQTDIVTQKTDVLTRREEILRAKKRISKRPIKQK